VVDERRVRRLLARIEEQVALLQHEAEDPAGVRGDFYRLAALKYVFVTAIESCIDVAHHLIASDHLGTAESNSDAMRMLATEGVLPPELGKRLAEAVGFRNLLVHQYADVDDDRVVGYLFRVSDLSDFVDAIAAYVERSSGV
jgi:uncharacterized protein YutE (UPF0331/DUF86 family)